ncbi:Nucleic acid-binding, OB-fold [Sesbania bispinosa]|nr:Nucleic acid-binding, OB-fold [Sesbania bispinosa]
MMKKISNCVTEGSVYKMTYFTIIANGGTYRATTHEFKLLFQPRTKVVPAESEIIPRGVVKCSLYGHFIDMMKGFMLTDANELSVVVIQFAKVMSLSTLLAITPGCCGTHKFQSIACHGIDMHGPLRMIGDLSFSMRDEFLSYFPRKTVEDLQLMEEFMIFIDIMRGTLFASQLLMLLYNMASGGCKTHVSEVIPRYKLKLEVNDGTEKANFVLFDFECAYLLDSSCAALVDQLQVKKPSHEYPEELNKLIGNEYLFKVEVKDDRAFRFDDTFKVKRVCQDKEIIREFKDDASIKTPGMMMGVLGGESENVDKCAGLAELYNDHEFRSSSLGESSNASACLAPQKRKNQSCATTLALSKKRGIPKTIKIEKD